MGLEQARRAIEHVVRVFLGSTLSAAWSLVPGSLDGGECAEFCVEFCVEHENCHRPYESIRALERAIERTIRNTTGEMKAVEVSHGLKRTRVRICRMFREEVFEMPDKWKWATVAVMNQIRNFFQWPLINELEDVDEVIHPGCNEIFVCHKPKDIPESAWLGLEKRMEEAVHHTTGYHAHAVVMDKSNNRTWIKITVMKRETIFDRLERKERECERDVNGYSIPPRSGKSALAMELEKMRERKRMLRAELEPTPEANAPHTFLTKRLNMDEPRLIIRDELADWAREQRQKKTEERKMFAVNEIVAITEGTKAIQLVDHKEETQKEIAMTAQVAAQYQNATVRKVDVAGDVLVLHVGHVKD